MEVTWRYIGATFPENRQKKMKTDNNGEDLNRYQLIVITKINREISLKLNWGLSAPVLGTIFLLHF
jgi:hypothetical protein